MSKVSDWFSEQFVASSDESKEYRMVSGDVKIEEYEQELKEEEEIKNKLKSQYTRKYDGSVESVFNFIESYANHIHQAEKITKSIIKEGVSEEELGFVNFIIEEELDSATRDGITIIDHASSFEIRTKGESKVLDGSVCEMLREIFTEDRNSNELRRGYVGYDTATNTTGSGGSSSTKTFGQSRLKSVDMEIDTRRCYFRCYSFHDGCKF